MIDILHENAAPPPDILSSRSWVVWRMVLVYNFKLEIGELIKLEDEIIDSFKHIEVFGANW